MPRKEGKKVNLFFSMPLILITAILFLDRITKIIASENLTLNQPLAFIPGFIDFTLVHNRGAAFGILKNQAPFFIFTSLAAIILICINFKHKQNIYNIPLGLILAGALGNLIDRIFLGYVVDFIDFRIWPVFNVADSAITIGAVLLGWSILKRTENREQRTEKSEK